MYDACAYRAPIAAPPRKPDHFASPPSNYWELLFLHSKGNIKVASSSSRQFSFGSEASGSFFTNAFSDAIHAPGVNTWQEVLQEASDITQNLAASKNRIQIPNYEFSPALLMENIIDNIRLLGLLLCLGMGLPCQGQQIHAILVSSTSDSQIGQGCQKNHDVVSAKISSIARLIGYEVELTEIIGNRVRLIKFARRLKDCLPVPMT